MSQLNDIINQINQLTGYNVPTSSVILISQSSNPVGSGSVNNIISEINTLTGFNIPSTAVQYVSGTNVAGPIIVYTPYAAGGTISTDGIIPGQIIRAEHVLRIINALNGVNVNDIIISGSFTTSGSNTLDGNLALPFLNEGEYLYISGGLVVGTQFPNVDTASYAIYAETASYAPLYLLVSDTGSMLQPYVLTASTSSMTVLSSSFALTASYAENAGTTIDTGSFVTTSSFNNFTASYNTFSSSYNTGSFSGSFTGSFNGTASWAYSASQAISSSYALTASYALNAGAGAGFPYSGSAVITGSLLVSGSGIVVTGSLNAPSITGSLFGTASWAYSSSFAISSSYAPTLPGGSDTQIQYNNSNTLAGDSAFTYNYTQQSLQQGNNTITSGSYSHAEGVGTIAYGVGSHAEGYGSWTGQLGYLTSNIDYNNIFNETAVVLDSSYGDITTLLNNASKLIIDDSDYNNNFGRQVLNNPSNATWDGTNTIIYFAGNYTTTTAIIGLWPEKAPAGANTPIRGNYAHSEGKDTAAAGIGSHAAGTGSFAQSNYSYAGGEGTVAYAQGQTVVGQYNEIGNPSIGNVNSFVIGKGTDNSTRSDIFKVSPGNDTFYVSASTIQFDGLPSTALTNVLVYNPSNGEVAYTASSAIGGKVFPFTGSAIISGSLTITGSISVTQGITGSLFGTASWAQSAITASYILSSNVAGLTQLATGSVTASVTPTQFTVISGSAVEFTVTGTGVTIGNASTDRHSVTGSLNITGSLIITGSDTNQTYLQIGTPNRPLLTVSGSSRIGINTFTPAYSLDVAGNGNFSQGLTITGSSPSIEPLRVSNGTTSLLFVSSSGNVGIGTTTPTANLQVNGNIVATSFTGSLFGTSSWASNAVTASYMTGSVFTSLNPALSASFATSASRAVTSSFALSANIFPFTGSAIISGSLTVTGSTNLNSGTGTTILSSNADTLTITGSLLITGSAIITGSINATSVTSSLFGTASWANNAVTASYILNAVSASFATTASYVTGSIFTSTNLARSASYALTASYIDGGFY